jgi:hypothetical protein
MPPRRKPPRHRAPTEDAIHRAEDLVWQAIEHFGEPEGIELLEQAVALDPACTDARLLLIEIDQPPLAERVPMLAKVTRDAAARLGPAYFKENAGHFWGLLETRPYMRARMQYAVALAESGREPKAIEEHLGLLHLCPGDNLGVRCGLLGLLLALDRFDDAERLIEQYADDIGATIAWGRVLLLFLRDDRESAASLLRLARGANRHVEPHLAARIKLPKESPESWSPGSEDEARMVARDLGEAWRRHPEAVIWLREQPARRREV